MRLGIHLPQIGRKARPDGIKRAAIQAEELGYDDVWTSEHIIVPAGAMYPPSPIFYDPVLSLTWAAAYTSRVRLGTSVLVLPMRHPLPLAKELATLQNLSGGRFILGAGVGWLEAEFAALGVPFKERGRRMDEGIEMMKAHGTYLVADIYNDYYILGKAVEFGLPRENVEKERMVGRLQRENFAKAAAALPSTSSIRCPAASIAARSSIRMPLIRSRVRTVRRVRSQSIRGTRKFGSPTKFSASSAAAASTRLRRLRRSLLIQRVDRRRLDDALDAARQLRVERNERVRLQLRARDVLGVVGRRPAELFCDVPGPAAEHGVAEEPDRHLPDALDTVACNLGGDLAALDGLVEH